MYLTSIKIGIGIIMRIVGVLTTEQTNVLIYIIRAFVIKGSTALSIRSGIIFHDTVKGEILQYDI